MTRLFLILLTLMMSMPAWSVVDMKNGNYADTWNDIIVPGSGFDLRVRRTYNSRSLFNGIFGFGWCSDFETSLQVTAEGNLKLTECGGGLEIHYFPKNYDKHQIRQKINQIVEALQRRDHNLTSQYIANLKNELLVNDTKRSAMAADLGMKSVIRNGTVFYVGGQQVENIVLRDNQYVRTLTDGTIQRFDRSGHLVVLYDKNGNYLRLSYNNGVLREVADNNGRKLEFHVNPTTKKVKEIDGPGGLVAHYRFNGDNLISVVNAWKNKYSYVYDDLHNITRINFPDKTYKALTYNEDRGWVTSFRDRYGCTENYSYEFSKDDPKNHYTSKVEKKCHGEVTNYAKYEFWHKPRHDGAGYYLARVKVSGKMDNVDITYHEQFGRPLSITRNGLTIHYTYFPDGLIQTKTSKFQNMTFDYDHADKRISQVKTVFKDQKGKPIRSRITKFRYDNKGNLTFAENSDGQKVWLTYDVHGRISSIRDQAKKVVEIGYEERFGKPSLVTRPGVGTIVVTYNAEGQIQKVDSKQGPIVAVQVASTFNNLLDIIAPATNELSI